MPDMTTLSVPPTPWIRDASFDGAWVFGGALAACAVCALALLHRELMPLIFWVWICTGDGPHMFATYVRTVLNPAARSAMRPLLLRSMWALAIGPACLIVDAIVGGERAFLAFNGLAGTYGFIHIVRQHYGYLALYRARAAGGEPSAREFWSDKLSLYAGVAIPYVYLIVSHPKSRVLLGLAPSEPSGTVAALFALGWLISLGVFCIETLRADRGVGPKLVYGALVILFHGAVYGLVGRMEPVYPASNGPNQDFLLLVILTSVFHNLQYVAIVSAMERDSGAAQNRKGEGTGDSKQSMRIKALLLVFPFFLVLYVMLARATGVFPLATGFGTLALGPFRACDLAMSLWWGLSIHHYYLDQNIWRIKRDPMLRKQLLP
jgi:hypothetical protein